MFEQIKAENLLDIGKTIAKPLFENAAYPWEALDGLKEFIMELGPALSKEEYEQKGKTSGLRKARGLRRAQALRVRLSSARKRKSAIARLSAGS